MCADFCYAIRQGDICTRFRFLSVSGIVLEQEDNIVVDNNVITVDVSFDFFNLCVLLISIK